MRWFSRVLRIARAPLAGVFLVGLATAWPVQAMADAGLACDLPAELTTPADPLMHAAAALAKAGGLNILAIGSGSTVGDSGSSGGAALSYRAPDGSYPYRMIEALQMMRPMAHFQLAVKGGRNMTAEVMLPILQQELSSHHYDVVLWQTGTVEAVHGMRPDGLRDVLQDGADAVDAANADLVMVDPQFSRFLRANADLAPYETVLQQMANNPGVTLFRRFDLTQNWVDNGQVDLERVGRNQRDKTIALLNNCLGQALARFILTGTGEH